MRYSHNALCSQPQCKGLFITHCCSNVNIQGHPSPDVSLVNVHIQTAECLPTSAVVNLNFGCKDTFFFFNRISVVKHNYCM